MNCKEMVAIVYGGNVVYIGHTEKEAKARFIGCFECDVDDLWNARGHYNDPGISVVECVVVWP
jgi:hypothetical protein